MPRKLPITDHLEAAALLARDVPVAEVARQMGVTRYTIRSWAKTDEAQAHMAAVKVGIEEATKHLAIADKVRRIRHAQKMLDGILAVIESRRVAGEASCDPLPGEATGHVAVKITEVTTEGRSGVRTTVTKEAAFDASLHDQARKWFEYVAKERGELDATLNVKHGGRVDHYHDVPNFDVLTMEQRFALDQMLAAAAEAGVS